MQVKTKGSTMPNDEQHDGELEDEDRAVLPFPPHARRKLAQEALAALLGISRDELLYSLAQGKIGVTMDNVIVSELEVINDQLVVTSFIPTKKRAKKRSKKKP
jgi:hypothetical protein